MKKAVALILALCCFISCFSISAGASYIAQGTCGENATWTLDNSGTLKINGRGPMHSWASADIPWDSYKGKILSVEISEGITTIGTSAFSWCSNLVSVTLPSTLETICATAFFYCRNLEEIVIPEGVIYLGNAAFDASGLKTIVLPKSLQKIGDSCFWICDSLTSVIYNGSPEMWSTIEIEPANNPLVNAELTCLLAPYNGLNNFVVTNTYENQFSDISDIDWYYENVKMSYELGLIKGVSEDRFNPNGNITIAETIALASRINSIYLGGSGQFEQGSPWYQVYIDYAIQNSIILDAQYDYNSTATRAQFASILAKSLYPSAYNKINDITQIPDVPSDAPYKSDVYMLYNAGILTGSDEEGSFNPNASIRRSEVSAIITRIVDTSLRKHFGLPIYAEKIYTQAELSLYVGESYQLPVSFVPENVTDKTITWRSNNTSVAQVSSTGVVTAIGKGNTSIVVTTSNGISTVCNVTVTKRESIKILTTSAVPNSAGGAEPIIIWRNDSGKTIKYITFYATPYNRVGDTVKCQITGYGTRGLKATGPYDTFDSKTDIDRGSFFYKNSIPSVSSYAGSYYVQHWSGEKYYLKVNDYENVFNIKTAWQPAWYNSNIYNIRISQVDIIYMDGSTETIYNPTIWREVWWQK